jgi:hypothetical protein
MSRLRLGGIGVLIVTPPPAPNLVVKADVGNSKVGWPITWPDTMATTGLQFACTTPM